MSLLRRYRFNRLDDPRKKIELTCDIEIDNFPLEFNRPYIIYDFEDTDNFFKLCGVVPQIKEIWDNINHEETCIVVTFIEKKPNGRSKNYQERRDRAGLRSEQDLPRLGEGGIS